MTSRKSLARNRLPKDRILYCDRCGISFLWSGEEQQVAGRPVREQATPYEGTGDEDSGVEEAAADHVDTDEGTSGAGTGAEPRVATPLSSGRQATAKVPTHCAGCRTLMPDADRERGIVKWYNPRKRFGFITREDGTEIFAHGSRLKNAKRLRDGSLVEFRATQSKQGPAATEIQVLEESPSTT